MVEVEIYNTQSSNIDGNSLKNMREKSVSSRLIKREKSKLLKQTVLAGCLSVFLLLLFLFFGLPNAPRLVGLIAGQGSGLTVSDSIPPQVPIIYLTTRDTNQSAFVLQGYTEPKAKVTVYHNGDDLNPVEADETGSFELKLGLDEGENSLSALAIDQVGNVSAQSKTEIVNLDTQVPEVTLVESIVTGMSVVGKDKQLFAIEGQTEPGSKITINDRFLFAKTDGSFSYRYRLQEGENQFNIKVNDKAGNESTKELKLIFKP